MFALLAAVALSGVAAYPSSAGLNAGLAANHAYRSPSLNVPELAIQPRHPHGKRWTEGSDNPTYTGNLSFPFGVASGDPYSDSAVLWTMARKVDLQGLYGGNDYPPVCLRWVVATNDTDFSIASSVQNGEVHSTADVRYAVKVVAEGLKPYTQYYYRFESCVGDASLGVSPVGAFKTLPAEDDDVTQLRLAVFSCANLPFGFFNAYGHAANTSEERQLDFVQHVGDYIYEYANGAYGDGTALGRIPQPLRECSSLADYSDRYESYRQDPDLQELHRKVAWQAVWDDHEVADNTWAHGSADSNDTMSGSVGGYEFSARKANAVRAYYTYMPIRQVDTDDKLRIWRNFKLGKLATLTMLDTRQYDRSQTDLYYNTPEIIKVAGASGRSMTGTKQQTWFERQLAEHKQRNATWPLVMQQVVFSLVNYTLASGGSTEFNVDAWAGYRYQRDTLLKYVEENEINNFVVLSGDSHATWVSDIRRENSTNYNATTGEGALGVEFAGSAVSSPSSYGYGPTFTDERYRGIAANLTLATPGLQYAEGQLRGYFQLLVTPNNVTADYFGFYDQETRNINATLMASFTTEAGSNKLTRPINGGKQLQFGAYAAGQL